MNDEKYKYRMLTVKMPEWLFREMKIELSKRDKTIQTYISELVKEDMKEVIWNINK